MTPLHVILRDARERAGLTQSALAAAVALRTGRSAESVRTQIARYERGVEPREAIVRAVLDALGLDLAAIPAGYEARTPRPKKDP